MIETPAQPGDLAIVLTGGGARAAYQVGVLRALGRHLPELRFPIITGVSAGGVNATFLAAHPGSLAEAADQLCDIWRSLSVDDIFRVDLPSLSRNLVRWATHLVAGGSSVAPDVHGLVDTAPLHATLARLAATVDEEIIGISRNLERGRLKGLAITTLNYSTGQTVTWVQGAGSASLTDRQRRTLPARITVDHIMASSALPVFFPAVRLGDSWHGDGGVRLSAPLSPALRLGATRILAVSPQYLCAEAERPKATGYPPLAQIFSELLNAIFLDVLEQDVERLEQTNQLLANLPPAQWEGLRPVDILLFRPSEDLGALAATYEPRLPKAFRYLTRSLGTRETTNPDFLSYLMFQPDYLEHLMEIGERDTEARIDEVRRLVEPDLPEPLAEAG
ncbi:MAG TPA: patatin-like phospholipase family protein [Thermoanaerobaculia bacterium]|nr:patatin-like phospholipase family protein [Thermoanaerobaculia bacterium]